jgi:homoserine dehydrogenase
LKNYNIAIAGVGVIGSELLNYINNKSLNFTKNSTSNIKPVITHVSSRRERVIPNVKWVDNPLKFIDNQEINLIIELIGGADGISYELVKSCLDKGKNIITANKALIAEHGNELFDIAKRNNCTLYFEAAVGGALPIIKLLNDNLYANQITKIAGILNGTCNFILSKMEEDDCDFNQALKIAQDKGFAEPDPHLDISGIDAAHKIAILSSLAFSNKILFENVKINSIENINKKTINIVKKLNYSLKLIACTIKKEHSIIQYVRPTLIGKNHSLKNINGALNSIYIESDPAIMSNIIGHGAGSKPTTSALISDIIDAIRGNKRNFSFHNNDYYCDNLNIKQNFIAIIDNKEEQKNTIKKLMELNLNYQEEQLLQHSIIKFSSNNFSDFYKINNSNIYEIYE